jgi:hypothetical protein
VWSGRYDGDPTRFVVDAKAVIGRVVTNPKAQKDAAAVRGKHAWSYKVDWNSIDRPSPVMTHRLTSKISTFCVTSVLAHLAQWKSLFLDA